MSASSPFVGHGARFYVTDDERHAQRAGRASSAASRNARLSPNTRSNVTVNHCGTFAFTLAFNYRGLDL